MRTLWHDIKYGLRLLARSRGFAVVAVLTLALGIGATTAVFSLVNGVLLRPLAYPDADRLVWLHEFIPQIAEKYPVLPVNARHFLEWRERCSSFANLSLVAPGTTNLTGWGQPEALEVVEVSANVFETLGVQAARGRTFAAEEDLDGHNHVAVISNGLWRRKFNADPAIIGTAVTLDSEMYTVVGVLPPEFRFPNPDPLDVAELRTSARPDLFIPKIYTAQEKRELMGMFNFSVIGRLNDRTTRAEALAELNVIAVQLVEMAGEPLELCAVVKPLKEALVEDSRRGLLILLGAVGSGLLIACLNLVSVNLVQAERRSFDTAVRAALGANRAQLLRQALTETALCSVLGAAFGLVVAGAGLRLLVAIAPSDIPRLGEVRIDANVLVFALALTVGTGLLSGLLPAWHGTRARPERALRATGRTATAAVGPLRVRSALVTAEVALGVVLLMATGLLLRSLVRIMRSDQGFHAPAVLAADMAPPQARYGNKEQKYSFHRRLLDQVISAPGVASAAIVSALPLEGETWVSAAWVAGDSRPDFERPSANVRFVSGDYFETMGVPLRDGRAFDETDRPRRVAVISRRLARMLWPEQEVVVGHLFLHEGKREYEVVGVAADVRANADREPVAMLYRPYWDGAPAETTVVARAAGDPFSIGGSVREAIHAVDADVPVSMMRTMREVLDRSVSQRRFQVRVACAFAVCALFLAALGVYGVVSYSVTRRTSEIGIRMAFGARPANVYAMVLRQGLMPVGLGLTAGVAGACGVTRFLRSLLYEISPYDSLTVLAVVAIMAFVAVAACYLPARRAARIDPMAALRYE